MWKRVVCFMQFCKTLYFAVIELWRYYMFINFPSLKITDVQMKNENLMRVFETFSLVKLKL